MKSFKKNLSWLGLPALILMTNLAMADSDYDEARRLRQSGDVLPLETILQKLQASHPGKVLEVELENEHNKVIYEIILLDNNNEVWKLKVNAKTGELLQKQEDD